MKNLFCKINLILILLVAFSFVPTFATDYFVDAVNGLNTNSGLSSSLAKQTIQSAANLTNPGDNVFIMNGTYNPISNYNQSILTISRSGTPGNYITYKAYSGHTPKLQLLTGLTFQIWRAIAIDASYIIVEGIEIEGTNQSLNYADAYQTWQDYENKNGDWNKISMYNCGSISIGNVADAHHVIVRNCKIHDTGGGIGGFRCDYITIENNLIYNNCWYSMYAGSGISILDPKSIDAVTSYKIFIRNNIVHNNKTLIPWERINALSDGNGIILDVNVGNGTTTFPYVGRYLIENNVSYNNGGGGVHAYKCAHVDIINNTAYNNGTVVGYPEIDANQCSDVKIYNNIMYARSGGNCNGNDADAIYDYNIYFNGPSYKNGPHDKTADPKFVNKALDGTANFQIQNTSPAINNGSATAGQFAAKDILGIARPVGFSSDMGAYEYPTVIPRSEMNLKQGTTDILDNTGSFDFGDVASTAPKIVTFTIQNLGDLALNLTGTPKVMVTGTGFSVVTDASAPVSANGSATFQVKLTPITTAGVYSGTISIANDDADENPYNFAITGYGYDGTKAIQTITFDALPVKEQGDADFNPGATTTSGLTIVYTSSNAAVATIVSGQIHIAGAGTTTITASQAGHAATNPAKTVTQVLTVTPALPPAGTNLITNSTFDANTTGWTFANKNGGAATLEMTTLTGYDTNVGKVTVTALGTGSAMDNIQLSYTVFVVKGRNYLVSFKGSVDVARNINMAFFMNVSPYSTLFTKNSIPLTTIPTNFGPYTFTSSNTGYISYRFLLGSTTSTPVYLDNISIIEDAPTGVNQIEATFNEVNAYPNPAKDILTVSYSAKSGANVAIRIYDLQGRLLSAKNYTSTIEGTNSVEFRVNSFRNGMYLLKMSGNSGLSKTIKILIRN